MRYAIARKNHGQLLGRQEVTEFEAALDRFLRGEQSFEGLRVAFQHAISRSPATADKPMEILENAYRTGRFPPQLYELFKSQSEELLGEKTNVVGTHKKRATPVPESGQLIYPELRQDRQQEECTRIADVRLSGSDAATRMVPDRKAAGIPSRGVSGPHTTTTQDLVSPRVGVGDTLKNRFVLEESIGQGGMGVVFKAIDRLKVEAKDQEPYVAVKVLNEDFKLYPDAFIVFQREARKAQKLAHPNIVNVYDFDRDDATSTVFMTMELLEGESLEQILHRAYPRALPLKEALSVVKGMGEALRHAHHHNIVHSDCKPGNVFIAPDGTVKVLDFGIARVARVPGETDQDASWLDPEDIDAVTPRYASCEMLEHGEPDPRDDIYGLACITYELLTGRHPFNRQPCTEARDSELTPTQPEGLSREQWKGLMHGLAFERSSRTPSVAQFLQELELTTKIPVVRGWLLTFLGGATLLAMSLWVYELLVDETTEPEPPIPIEELDEKTYAEVQRYLSLAEVELGMGRMQDALFAFQRVLYFHPRNRDAVAGLERIAKEYGKAAQANLRGGNLRKALSMVEAGLQARSEQSALLALKERIEQKLGQKPDKSK